MQKMRRRLKKICIAIAMFVLILPVISACKNKPKEKKVEIIEIDQEIQNLPTPPGPDYFSYYRNFKIVEAVMSRASIEGVPSKGKNLYILRLNTVGCNLDYLKSKGYGFVGGFLRACVGGSIDSVDDLIITRKGRKISHTPLRWKEIKQYGYCQIWISSQKGDKDEIIYYNHKPEKILEEIRWPAISILMRPTDNNVYKFGYLLSFNKSKSLPDSAVLKLSGGDVNIKIDNSKVEKYSVYKMRNMEFEGSLYTSKCYDNI